GRRARVLIVADAHRGGARGPRGGGALAGAALQRDGGGGARGRAGADDRDSDDQPGLARSPQGAAGGRCVRSLGTTAGERGRGKGSAIRRHDEPGATAHLRYRGTGAGDPLVRLRRRAVRRNGDRGVGASVARGATVSVAGGPG